MDTQQADQKTTVRVEEIGEERNPVIIIENALQGAETLVDAACAQGGFLPKGPYYPGVRSSAPNAYVDAIGRAYGAIICKVFGWQNEGMQPTASDFSLVTTPPDRLVRYQRLPHIDGTSADTVAVLHYLCGRDKGGTGFFRHCSTGYETLDDGRHPVYTRALEAELSGAGEPEARYPGSSPHFDMVQTYPCAFNRIIAYRGNVLHSGLIPESMDFSDDPRQGRLTLNTFFQRGPRRA